MRPRKMALVLPLFVLAASSGLLLGRTLGARSAASGPGDREEGAAREVDEARARRDRLQEEIARLEAAGHPVAPPSVPPAKGGKGNAPRRSTILLPVEESVRRTVEHELETLEPHLGFLPEQKPKVQAILETHERPVIDELYRGNSIRDVSEREEAAARAELALVLTPDQLSRYDRFRTERAAGAIRKALEREAEECSDTLGLNAGQRKSLQAAMERDPLLTRHADEGSTVGSLDAEMEQYRQRQVRLRAATAPLLTGDQVSRFEAYLEKQEDEYRQRMKLYLAFRARGEKR